MNIYTNKAIITRTSKTYNPSGKPDIKALIREYMRLLLKYNELARLHNITPETPINFSNINNINDELLMAIILRLRRAIKLLEHLPLKEEEEEEETPEPEPEDPTWYAIKTSNVKPALSDRIPFEGFILDGWFYHLSPIQTTKLLCIPVTYLSAYTENERYTSLSNNTLPYYNVIFGDDTIMAVYRRGTTVSKITSEDMFDGITFQNNPPTLTVAETIKNDPAET